LDDGIAGPCKWANEVENLGGIIKRNMLAGKGKAISSEDTIVQGLTFH
jgi:hypothetical protein